MSMLLRSGQQVTTQSGQPCTVDEFLGGGGQGEVYRARLGGEQVALKWYHATSATPAQRSILETLVRRGPPNPNFLWPLELVSSPQRPEFGYIMALRENRFRSIIDLMNGDADPKFRAVTTICLELARSFLELHTMGFSYRDISFGNVFFDPATGEVRICDNDNVTVDGQAPATVLGTPRFMAPEIVRGEAMPSTQTDLYSLSVLLFYLLTVHHPLDGRRERAVHCLDLAAMNKLYGIDPLFVFDPENNDNRPVPGEQDGLIQGWEVLPEFVRGLFVRAFTEGLRDPQHGRVRESEWRAALVRLRDSIVTCASCGAESFYDVEVIRAHGGRLKPCWSCQGSVELPFRVRIGQNVVMLTHEAVLYPHHLNTQQLYDFTRPVAAVVRHPTLPAILGLRNLSSNKWVLVKQDGSVQDVQPGRSVTLAPDLKIQFGTAEGEVRG